MTESLRSEVLPHISRDDLAARMTAFYAEVDEAVADHNPVCRNRGVCCRFEQYGHKLYVTNVELAFFVQDNSRQWRTPVDDGACPYHVAGRCTARSSRPLGCRVFFCDLASRGWQGPEYERRLGQLKRIGAALGIEYRYTDWLSALRALDEPPAASNPAVRAEIDAGRGDMIE